MKEDHSLDKQAIESLMLSHFNARQSGNSEQVISHYSERWRDSKGYRKESLNTGRLSFTTGAFWSQIQVNMEDAIVTTEKNMATFGPVLISTSKGVITYEYKLEKEDDRIWRIVFTKTLAWEEVEDQRSASLKREINETAMLVREHREKLLSDHHRPGYHFTVPEGFAVPFDPNGAIYWKGRYHLFYIFQDSRSGKKSDHWGHISSTDLFHWRHHPTGLVGGMYSGNCFLNSNGVPTMCYHEVDLGNSLAISKDDDLNQWDKLNSNPITPDDTELETDKSGSINPHKRGYRSWDPFGWCSSGNYYAIFGGESPSVAKATQLNGKWHYIGDLFAHQIEGISAEEDVSCPDLFRLGDKDILLCISHRMGCRYYVGEWKNEQYYPEHHAQMSWVDNTFFAPESLEDERGRRIMWAWLLDYRDLEARLYQGWSGTLSLPRVLNLGKDGLLEIDIAEEIETLRYRHSRKTEITIQAEKKLYIQDVSGSSLELNLKLVTNNSLRVGIAVCVCESLGEETRVTYDAQNNLLEVDTQKSGPMGSPKDIESAPLNLQPEEVLELRIFIDRSVVEVFANKKQAIARRIYPSKNNGMKIYLFSENQSVKINSLDSWHMSPSNPY